MLFKAPGRDFPGGSDNQNLPTMQELGVQSFRKILVEKEKTVSTPVFLPGEFHGQRNLADYNPWGCKELDLTEQLAFSFHECAATQCPGVSQGSKQFLVHNISSQEIK